MKAVSKIFLAVVLAGFTLSARASLVDAISAIAGDSIITYQQIQSILMQMDETLKMEANGSQEKYERLHAQHGGEILDTLVSEKMILHEFSSAGFKIPESIIDGYVQDRIQERFQGDHVALTKMLQHNGLTYEDFKLQLHDDFIVQVMRQKYVPDPIISPLKVETYYEAHKNDFKVEDEYKMRMIVLNRPLDDANGTVRKRMEEIMSQVKDGASFSDLAKSYSEGSQARDGGETGWQQTSTLNKAIIDAVRNLKPGEYSGIIESPGAYFFVLLEERRAARIRPLSELRADIEKTLLVQEKNRLWTRWINRLKRKTFIQTF